MNSILICSHDPMFLRNLCIPLREEGLTVDTVDHPAFAVQKALGYAYEAVVIDSECVGMSAFDAARIINSAATGVKVVIAGGRAATEARHVRKPVDVSELIETIAEMLPIKTKGEPG